MTAEEAQRENRSLPLGRGAKIQEPAKQYLRRQGVQKKRAVVAAKPD